MGERVRYDGGHKLDRYITDTLGRHFRIIAVCPEAECGLPVPRESMELIGELAGTRKNPRLIGTQSRTDFTRKLLSWTKRRLKALEAESLSGFVFKARSPSCSADIQRPGLFASAFTERFPLVAVIDEEGLGSALQREAFLQSVVAHHRWLALEAKGLTASGLMDFHSSYKLMLMAHSVSHYRSLGRLTGSMKGRIPASQYIAGLMQALSIPATPGRHANALAHAGGYFKRVLSAREKASLKELIESVRAGEMQAMAGIALINHFIKVYGEDYLAGQAYLNPHPVETAAYR